MELLNCTGLPTIQCIISEKDFCFFFLSKLKNGIMESRVGHWSIQLIHDHQVHSLFICIAPVICYADYLLNGNGQTSSGSLWIWVKKYKNKNIKEKYLSLSNMILNGFYMVFEVRYMSAKYQLKLGTSRIIKLSHLTKMP